MKMLAQFEAKLNAANRLNLASSYDDDEEEDDPTAVTTQDVHSSSAWLVCTSKFFNELLFSLDVRLLDFV